jgi:hypothetical protein
MADLIAPARGPFNRPVPVAFRPCVCFVQGSAALVLVPHVDKSSENHCWCSAFHCIRKICDDPTVQLWGWEAGTHAADEAPGEEKILDPHPTGGAPSNFKGCCEAAGQHSDENIAQQECIIQYEPRLLLPIIRTDTILRSYYSSPP